MGVLNGRIVRAEPLNQQVYKVIKEAILTGKMKPGEKIVETKLAEQLHTSRSPVREALRLLTAEQLVFDDNGAIQVFQPSFADFQQLYELRIAVESGAAELAARRAKQQDCEELDRILRDTAVCLETGQMDCLIELNTRFHDAILRISGNARFQKIVHDVWPVVHYYGFFVLGVIRQQTNLLAEHTAVVEAIKTGDGEQASRTMRAHIRRDLEVITAAHAQDAWGS